MSSTKTRPVSISLPPESIAALDEAAKRANLPRSAVIRHLIARSFSHRPWFETKFDSAMPPRCVANLTPGVAGWTGPAVAWTAQEGEDLGNFRNRIAADLAAAGFGLAGATVTIIAHPAWETWGGRPPKKYRAKA